MSIVLNKIKRSLKQFRGLFNSRIPTGVTEFHMWVEDIIATYDLPTYHRDSISFGLSSMLMRLNPDEDKKPKYYFVRVLRTGATKQIAHSVLTEIKERHKALEDAAKLNQSTPVEATTKLSVVGNGETKQDSRV